MFAFSQTLIGGQFACAHAEPVVRRGGAEIACRSADASQRCATLMQCLKDAALPAFGDDQPRRCEVGPNAWAVLTLERQPGLQAPICHG